MNAVLRKIAFCLAAGVAIGGAAAYVAHASRLASNQAAPVFLTTIPPGYRDWRLISVAHEEGNLNSFAAVLGNDVAIKAYRDGTLPFPDGTMIAALHYSHTASDENNKVFGKVQSYVPGPATNIQFIAKDSKKYAATGGWGFGHFGADGKPGSETLLETCFPCHAKASRDFVFTQYAH